MYVCMCILIPSIFISTNECIAQTNNVVCVKQQLALIRVAKL